jgi:hypothetical protein
MLARWFLPLLWSAIRLCAGTSHVWRRPQYLAHAQSLATRRDFPSSLPKQPRAGPGTLRRMVWSRVLMGFVFGVLALSLQYVASPVTGEPMGLLRVMTLGSGAFPVLSHAEQGPLTTVAHLVAPPDENFILNAYDVDDDDASDMPLWILRADVLPLVPAGISFHDSTHACLWPTHYLVRPQLLTRL